MARLGFLYLSLQCIVLGLIPRICRGDLEVEREALLALYDSTDGPNWDENAGWATADANLTNYYGVEVNGSFVQELDLSSNGLKGPLPPEIGNLSGIVSLDLAVNFLSGPIPPEIGKLTTLDELIMNTNSLSGPIPPEIAGMTALTGVWLFSNDLDGNVPPELGSMESLVALHLGENELTGEIPTALGNLTSLQYLNLGSNLLTGQIPEEIATLVTHFNIRQGLLLEKNYLSGSVPDGLFDLTTTYFQFDLSQNLLTGWPDQRDESATAPPLATIAPTPAPSFADTATPATSDGELEDSGVTSSTSSPASGTSSANPDSPPSSSGVTLAPVASDSGNIAPSSSSGSGTMIAEVAGGVVAGVVILAGLVGLCLVRKRKRETKSDVLPMKNIHSRSNSDRSQQAFAHLPGGGGDGDDGGGSGGEAATYSWTNHNVGRGGSRRSLDANTRGDDDNVSGNPNTKGNGIPLVPSFDASKDPAATAAAAGNWTHRSGGGGGGGSGGGGGGDGGGGDGGGDRNGGGGTSGETRRQGAGGVLEGAGGTVMDIATAVMAAAEGLAQQSFVPGVREAATVVSGLVKLAADHRSNAGDMEKRVRWCRSIVLTLERAGEVLGKAEGKHGEAERVLLEDVQESIADMVQIMQSYKNKNMVSRVFVSTLCKRRQEEAEAAINSTVQRLQLGLQVRAGHRLDSVGQAVEEGLVLQRQANEDSRAAGKRQRRRQRLDQLEIPATDVDITDEILGRGGFGTVYLADFNGLNAAAKVVVFDDGEGSDFNDDEDDDDEDDDEDDDDADGVGVVVGGGDRQHNSHDHGRNQTQPHRRHTTSAKTSSTSKANRAARSQDKQRKAFMRELEAMKRLRGPHTVHIYGAITSSKSRLVLVMELLPGGDLRYKLRKAREPLDRAVLHGIVKDVCSGMAFLHSRKTVHGDLKSANVLFDAAGRAKIADFGTSLWTQHTTRLATYTTKPRETVGMSLPWAAPEVLNRQGPSFKTDVYSFGMVVWECLTRRIPWSDVAGVDMLVLAVIGGERPPVPAEAPADLASLTRACWAQAPSSRPAFKNILSSLNATASQDEEAGSSLSAEANRGGGGTRPDARGDMTRSSSELDGSGVDGMAAPPLLESTEEEAAATAVMAAETGAVGVGGVEKLPPTTRELTSSTVSQSTVSLSSYTLSSAGSDKVLGDVGRRSNGDGYRRKVEASAAPPNRHRRRNSQLGGSGGLTTAAPVAGTSAPRRRAPKQ